MVQSRNLLFICLIFAATFSNMCSAQGSFLQLLCPNLRVGVSRFACSSLINQPVCVHYKNGTSKTFQNSCFGCAADRADIQYYNNFSCPDSSVHPTPVHPTPASPPVAVAPSTSVSSAPSPAVPITPPTPVTSAPVSSGPSPAVPITPPTPVTSGPSPAVPIAPTSDPIRRGQSVPPMFQCPVNPPHTVNLIACNGLGNQPVCAHYNDGTTKQFQNSCFACANSANLKYYNNFACN